MRIFANYHESPSIRFNRVPHGLWFDEPLIMNQIVLSCFRNINRAKFKHFLAEKNTNKDMTICENLADAIFAVSEIQAQTNHLFMKFDS